MKSVLFAATLCAALLAGCALDPVRSLPPGAPMDEVLARFGEPYARTRGADGTERWVYPTGPMGRSSYLVEFDRDARVRSVMDMLTDQGFARIEIGKTTQDEVRALFGPPYRVIPFWRKRETAWDYRFRDVWLYPAIFSVIFDERGVVASTMQQREFYGRESMPF
jgi:outer membrane protein assembly factor BamE (lipoprotein component of BamABCDE complex)